MNLLKLFLVSLAFIFYIHHSNAQVLNWKSLDGAKHIINVDFGLDYSVAYGIGYGNKLNTKIPVVLNASLSIPSGEKVPDDFKTKIGGQICLLDKSNFVGSVSIYAIYRKHENNFVRLKNFGSDMKGTFGYYKPKWFVTAEIGFDKAIVTHFKHSNEFKDEIYADVVDGWYEPSTGGNFYYGLSTGYSLKKIDVTLNLGKVISQDFKTATLIPFYLSLGLNYKL